ncbi:glycyl-tRNA synthetase 1 [Sarocladium strictum]
MYERSRQDGVYLHTRPPLLRAQPPQSKAKAPPLAMSTAATTLKGQPLDRTVLDGMLRRRMFYTPSFEIYGGVSGLYDYGPPGTSLQSNILDVWRKHFVLEEDMLEVDCSVLTPHSVFKTSGHVDRFSDWMCRDPKSGDIFRADHFVEDILEGRLDGDKKARQVAVEEKTKDAKREKKKVKGQVEAVKLEDAVVKEYEEILAQIDNFDGPALGELIRKYDLRVPASGELPTEPVAFNLMFQTSIGPSSNLPGYLRPETAQGQFLNFAKLLEFNQSSMPFASASIGKSYRNEISPRAGLLRVREFLMAEIEHFVDPESGKAHSRFAEIENIEMDLLDRDTQLSGSTKVRTMTIGQAVKDGVVDNQTLGYFLARIKLFLQKIGVDLRKLRFRQHMAHYACDCWDAELLTTTGWVECVGCADRSAYDLTVHAKATDKPLFVREQLETPRQIEEWDVEIQKKKFGPLFKKDAKAIETVLTASTQECRERWAQELKDNGKVSVDVPELGSKEVTSDVFAVKWITRTEHVREYTPNVIEPSFGIGRILYALCEHVYWVREGDDEARSVLSFPVTVAPTKVLICPLSGNKEFTPAVLDLTKKLRAAQISTRVDDSSSSIGKRYSRNDELGTALALTVDFQTVKDGSVTLRERDSTRQIRAETDKVIEVIKDLVAGNKTWEEVEKELPKFEGQETEVVVGQ